MKVILDDKNGTLTLEDGDGRPRVMDLYTKEAFEILSNQWVRIGWNQKYQYSFSWLGRPIIQLPEDMIRAQEVIYRVKPDVIIETGVAHGGSLVFYAGLCQLIGHGRVIGIDIEIRPHNRHAIESHRLFSKITLLEGDSTSSEVIKKVEEMIHPGETVMVFLDSNHRREHVLKELQAYARFVTCDSYLIATDGIMSSLADVPRGHIDWVDDNPKTAAHEFAASNPNFSIEQPTWPFNESNLMNNITHWPDAWLRRIRQ